MIGAGWWRVALVAMLVGIFLHWEFLNRTHKDELRDAIVLLAFIGAVYAGLCAWWWLLHPVAGWTPEGRQRLIWTCLGVAFAAPMVAYVFACLRGILHDLRRQRAPQVVLQVLAIVLSLAFLAWWFLPAFAGGAAHPG